MTRRVTRRRAVLGGLGAAVAAAGAWLGLRNGVEPPEGVVQTVDRYGDARQQDAQWWAPPRAGRLPTVV
ncbi:MAG TPA: hypothetical protein VNU66_13050, partial [Mycobacteriales bacterium]|nr:hypothetical protein [Mycobacteriales bacterium]